MRVWAAGGIFSSRFCSGGSCQETTTEAERAEKTRPGTEGPSPDPGDALPMRRGSRWSCGRTGEGPRRPAPAHAFAGRAHTGTARCPALGPRAHRGAWLLTCRSLRALGGRAPRGRRAGLPLRLATLSGLPWGRGAVSGVGVGASSAPEERPRLRGAAAAARSLLARRPGSGRDRKGAQASRPARTWAELQARIPGVARPPQDSPPALPHPQHCPRRCHFPCPDATPALCLRLPTREASGARAEREGCSRRGWARQTSPASVTEPVGMGPWAWV